MALAALGLLAAMPEARAEPACSIAVLGDSLTAGLGLDLEDAFPARLEEALHARSWPCAVVDAGVSGDTSAGGAARAGWVLADRPSHLLVELGGNDALRALPADQLEANLERIMAEAAAAGVPVLLAGMLAPPNLGKTYGEAFSAAFATVAERHEVPLYPFFLEGVAARPELLQADGIHPNAEGVERIVENILPAIERWLDATGVRPAS
ncbi:arylesterase [Geminicoccaceae bacterium 1502E]|nr:arylesterase [Geminicoccaceae bacterium 1502E]